MTRLPAPYGQWIDRDSPVDFRFEGRTYHGYQGDVVTSALWAAGERMVGRSFKYHRGRGTQSLAASDTAAMLDDGERINLRGDVLPICRGLDVRSVNTPGGLKGDWLRFTQWVARLMPVGFYYKAFHTPRRLFPAYERLLRNVAGLGRIHPETRCPPSPKKYAFCELLVIGAGPSGLAGALAAANQGVRVLLVDEQRRPGGSLSWQWAADDDARNHRETLLAQVESHENIELLCGTQVAGSYADRWFALVDDSRLTKLRADAVLVAAGAVEQPAVFQNNDLPGVVLGSAAQRLMHLYAVKPFERCVVLAANSDAYRVALDLASAGVAVTGIVDLRAGGEPSVLASKAAAAGIASFSHHAVYEALPCRGGTGVSGAVVCPLDEADRPNVAANSRLACDGIVVSVGWAPAAAPLYQGGARMVYSHEVEQFVPQLLPEGLFAAGRVNGIFELEDRLADGHRAGLAAAAFLGRYAQPVPPPPARRGPPPSHPYPVIPHPGKKNFVDLDEDLHLADLANAHQEGYDNIELLKRYTTVGMGPSQGKLANMNSVRILARLNERSVGDTGSTTSRPFYHPVPISHLAGRRFRPLRRTPMHTWHLKHGGQMVHVGAWLRPEHYRADTTNREDAILAEARHVRQQVGLIDLGTLGKIQISGPNAAEFIERIYTGRFRDQRIGTLRYGVVCDESGVITDDGIVARLSEQEFYVTATTGGAAVLFREMQRWALIWKMDIVLANVTGQWTAMNLAGPNARALLAAVTDVELAAESFPFCGVREGLVAGIPAMLLRVGFVGELGYEIHVPASTGLHVWQTLLSEGVPFGVRPFGVEAQRLLRLEKGHFIVGHDTDALTNPYEAGVDWALAMDKPFFVGQRSLQIVQQHSLNRRLVGIRIATDGSAASPQECHLIVDRQHVVGRITSVACRSTLDRAIGLAFIQPDLSEPGTRLSIRVDGGRLVPAQVCALPFFDPRNERQQA